MRSAAIQHPRASLVVRVPAGYAAERRYILGVVLSDWLGFDFSMVIGSASIVSIALQGDDRERVITVPDVLFSTAASDWMTERALPRRPLARMRPDRDEPASPRTSPAPLPILFGTPIVNGSAWQDGPDGITLAVDVFGSAFFLLAGIEEISRPLHDGHDRFPAAAAVSVQEGFVERPIVDEYVDLLWEAMQRLWPGLTRRPAGYRLRLTHDIDTPWASWGRSAAAVAKSVGGDLLRRRDPVLAAGRIMGWLDARSGRSDRDPYATYDFLMETSEQNGLRSVFYFLGGGDRGDGDFRYRLSDAPFIAILRRIHERGHEVGLHASYGSHGSAGSVREELLALVAACNAAGFEQSAWGVRQHYLRFAYPLTWRNQEAAGLAHDSTIGYAERVGFRAGTCREFPVFDALESRVLRLVERPLIAMDSTMLGYLHLGLEDAAERLRRVVDECRREGGDAVLLFHSDTLARGSVRARYPGLVEELSRPTRVPPAEPGR